MADRTVVYRIQADVTQARAQMAALGASVKKSAGDMTSATREGAAFRQGLDSLGGAAGKVGLVAAVGLGAAIKKAADFDASMSLVQAATMESATAMEDLRQAALQAGADTAFSATEAAAGIENLAKAGLSTADILNGGLAGALDLAAAGEMSVADAAEAAAGALAQFKLEGDQATHVADLLAAGAGKAQGDVSDMVMALKQAGTVSAQTGLSLEETTGSLAAMAEQSLLGSDAGTSFKTMLAALTPNSEKAANAMEAYNIHAFDAQGNFVGMAELAGQLESGLGGLTNEQRAMTMETIFGSDAVRAASIIYDNGAAGIQGWIDKTNDSGYAAETAATKLDNLKGDLEALGGSFETALIGTGSGSQGMLRGLTQNLTDTVNAYNKLGDGAKGGVATTLAATALLGGGLFVFSKMVQSIAATRLALTQLGVTAATTSKLMSAVGKAGFGLAGLAAAGMAAESLRKSLEESLPGMSELTGQILAISEGKVTSLGSEFDSLSNSIKRMSDNNGYIMDSSDAITGLLTLGILDGKEIDGSRQQIEALDEALANLASSGGSGVASKAFKDLAAAQGLTSDEAETLLTILPSYTEALASNENQADLTSGAMGALANATRYAVDASGKLVPVTVGLTAATTDYKYAAAGAAEEVESFKDKLDRLNAVLDGRASLRDYEAALDDFTDGLKENGRTFDTNTEKGRANQAALDNIAGSALAVAGTMRGAARQKFLTSAIDDIRTMGQNMGLPKSEIKALIALLVEANKKDVKPTVAVDTAPAFASFRAIDQWMADLDGKRATTYVDTVRTVTGPLGGAAFSQKSEGGPIYGPGTATSDSIPALLSNGEYVIKAAAVDRYGTGFFDRANAMRLAGGGSVDGDKERAEARRLKKLENQMTKALLSSDLRDEQEQARLEVQDARRRLKSAKEANRPKSEIRDAQLALKTERIGLQDMLQDAAASNAAEALIPAATLQEEAARIGLQAAEDQKKAAEDQKKAAENSLQATQQFSDSLASSVSGQFSNSLTGGGLAGLSKTLSKDIAGGSGMAQTLEALVAAGLDTTGASAGLFQELASSNDLDTSQQLLDAGPDAISYLERQYAQRASINQARGSFAADASYGPLLAQQSAAVAVAQQAATVAEVSASRLQDQMDAANANLQTLQGAVEQQAGQFAAALNAVSAIAGRGGSSSGWPNKGGWGR